MITVIAIAAGALLSACGLLWVPRGRIVEAGLVVVAAGLVVGMVAAVALLRVGAVVHDYTVEAAAVIGVQGMMGGLMAYGVTLRLWRRRDLQEAVP